MIKRLSGHEIVCGYERMGRAVVEELRRAGRSVVVVERSTARVRRLRERASRSLRVTGRPNRCYGRRTSQTRAGWCPVATTMPTTSAPCLPHGRSTRSCSSRPARRRRVRNSGSSIAGADRVVNPYDLGGTRLAHLVVKRAIVSFFDASLEGTDLQLDQTLLRADGPVVDSTLPEMKLRQPMAFWGRRRPARSSGLSKPRPGFQVAGRRGTGGVWEA